VLDINQAIKLDAEDPESFRIRGDIRVNRGEYQLALEDYDHALNLEPEADFRVYRGRAKAWFHLNDYERARKDVRRVQELGEELEGEFLEALQKATSQPSPPDPQPQDSQPTAPPTSGPTE